MRQHDLELGEVGGAVVEALRRRELPVRALVRREDERAQALRATGAEVVVGDLTRPYPLALLTDAVATAGETYLREGLTSVTEAGVGGGWVGAGNFAVTNVTTAAAVSIAGNNTNSGWLVGGGVEYAWTPNWSTKLEFDYLGLHSASYTVPATSPVLPGDVFNSTGRSLYMLTGGVNYLFNFGG